MAWTIRPALVADADAIASVHISSWQTAYRGLLPDDFLDGLPGNRDRRRAGWECLLRRPDPPGSAVFVAEDGDAGITGFAAAGPNREPGWAYDAEIHSIYLLAGHRRHGIGRALLRACVAHLRARGYGSLLVWVLDGNPAAAFYAVLGGRMIEGARIPRTIGGVEVAEIAYGWQALPEA